jgi:hypothetical protein
VTIVQLSLVSCHRPTCTHLLAVYSKQTFFSYAFGNGWIQWQIIPQVQEVLPGLFTLMRASKQSQLNFFSILFTKIVHNRYNPLLTYTSCILLWILQCNGYNIKFLASYKSRYRCCCQQQLAITASCLAAHTSACHTGNVYQLFQ